MNQIQYLTDACVDRLHEVCRSEEEAEEIAKLLEYSIDTFIKKADILNSTLFSYSHIPFTEVWTECVLAVSPYGKQRSHIEDDDYDY